MEWQNAKKNGYSDFSLVVHLEMMTIAKAFTLADMILSRGRLLGSL